MHCDRDNRGAATTPILETRRRAQMGDAPLPHRFDAVARMVPARTDNAPAPSLGPDGHWPATAFAAAPSEVRRVIDRVGWHA